MSRSSFLILLGILIILAPYSGLPVAFRTLLEVIFGLCVFGIGLAMRTHKPPQASNGAPSSTSSPNSLPPAGPSAI